MKHVLKPGTVHEFSYRIPRDKTVPFLYPESPDFTAMPEVFATGFMVGLIEWACVQALRAARPPAQRRGAGAAPAASARGRST